MKPSKLVIGFAALSSTIHAAVFWRDGGPLNTTIAAMLAALAVALLCHLIRLTCPPQRARQPMTFPERVAAVAAQTPSPDTVAQLEALLEEAKDIIVADRYETQATHMAECQIKAIYQHLGRHMRDVD